MDLSECIAGFVTETSYDKLPAGAIETAKMAVLDCVGVALGGSQEPAGHITAKIAREERSKEEATLFGHGFRSSALQAAFVNGTAAHALDFDHSFVIAGQPMAPIIPATLALAESIGASGRQVIEAYAAGFEVVARLVLAIGRFEGDSGWHAPGTLGSLGATLAVAKLLGFNAGQIETSLGIASSMASGLDSNFGTMTKPLHIGLAARNGVLASRLVSEGFTANGGSLQAGNGFFATLYGNFKLDEGQFEELGRSYALETHGIRIKPYPCGGLTHQAIDAMLSLRNEHGITAANVQAIEVDVSEHTYKTIVFRRPEVGLQGKFSMGYLMARAVVDGKITPDTFTDVAVRDVAVIQLLEKVEMRFDPEFEPGDDGSRPSKVTAYLKDGRKVAKRVDFAKGSRSAPLTSDELETKFRGCAERALDNGSIDGALESLARFEDIEDVSSLCRLLGGRS